MTNTSKKVNTFTKHSARKGEHITWQYWYSTIQNDWGWTQRILGDGRTQGVDRCPMFELLPVLKPFKYRLACPCGRARKGEREGDTEKKGGLWGQTGEIKARTLSLLLWPAGSGGWQLKKQPLATFPSRHSSTSRRTHMIYSLTLAELKNDPPALNQFCLQ